MFKRTFCMDLKRGLISWRFVLIVISITAMLFFSQWDGFVLALKSGWTGDVFKNQFSSVNFLTNAMLSNMFGVINVILLSGLYTGSFCEEVNHQYFRMIVARVDTRTYTLSKFLANIVMILSASILSSLLFVLIYLPFGFALSGAKFGTILYYQTIIDHYPVIYVIMLGLQFGAIAAIGSSIGLLLSVYQPNAFVCIAVSGFIFMVFRNADWLGGTSFDIREMIFLEPVLPGGRDVPRLISFLWGILWPLCVSALCGIAFERRMKWRAKHGII